MSEIHLVVLGRLNPAIMINVRIGYPDRRRSSTNLGTPISCRDRSYRTSNSVMCRETQPRRMGSYRWCEIIPPGPHLRAMAPSIIKERLLVWEFATAAPEYSRNIVTISVKSVLEIAAHNFVGINGIIIGQLSKCVDQWRRADPIRYV